MSEREMLERAAAAAGICGEYGSLFGDEGICVMRAPGSRIWTGKVWNPLTDDGDALRLAVRLCMQVECSRGWQHVSVYGHDFTISEQHDGEDPYAATRLAITRAAAALAPTAQGE